MTSVPTLHIRNVPPGVYERLRDSAAANGRSLNAEVVAVLARATGGWRSDPDFPRAMDALRARIQARLGSDAPAPEDLIRFDRDHR